MDKGVYAIDDDTYFYYGYHVTKGGEILRPNKNGEYTIPVKSYCFMFPGSHVTLNIDGKGHKIMKAMLIYRLFTEEEVGRDQVLCFKDEDRTNCALDNLYTIPRKEFLEKLDEYNQKKFDKKTERRIRDIYYKHQTFRDADGKISKPSVRKLSQKYGCSIKVMQKLLKNS